MAITYSVNNRLIPTVPIARWPKNPNSEQYTGVKGYSPWYSHVWIVSRMRMDDYEFLESLRGSQLINITTSDIANPNVEKTYADARMVDISGNHIGLTMDNVMVQFLVRESDV